MFLNRALFDRVLDLTTQLATALAERHAIDRENVRLVTINEWMRTRINFLEIERGQLMQKVAGIAPVVPEIESINGDGFSSHGGAPNMAMITNMFEDLDEEHDELRTQDQKDAAVLLAERGLRMPRVVNGS